jgi:zeaxanthin glucosyltransferase
MATIIFKCFDTPSHYNATYKLAHELIMRSHRVIYIGHPSFRETIIGQGFEFYNHTIYPAREKAPKDNIIKQIINKYRRIKHKEEHYLKGLPLEGVIQKFKPDLFILDVTLNYLFPILLERGIKFIIYNTKVNLNKANNIPPVTSSFVPKDDIWSKIKVELIWRKRFIRRQSILAYRKLICFGSPNIMLISKYLRKININPKHIIDMNRVGHFGIKTAPEIIFSLQEFDFENKIEDNQFYMCPCVDLTRNELFKDISCPEVLQKSNSSVDFDKIVYCSFGSNDSKYRITRIKFLVNLINIFLRKKNYLLIVSIGKDVKPGWFKLEAPNIYLYQTVPQLEILSKCDLMINQGGMQSVQECILKQVPMLVYPLNPAFDQEGNAARVVYHGLGVRGNIRKDIESEIEMKIEKVLNESTFKSNIKDFKRKCLLNDSFERGLEFIEGYIKCSNYNVVSKKSLLHSVSSHQHKVKIS